MFERVEEKNIFHDHEVNNSVEFRTSSLNRHVMVKKVGNFMDFVWHEDKQTGRQVYNKHQFDLQQSLLSKMRLVQK